MDKDNLLLLKKVAIFFNVWLCKPQMGLYSLLSITDVFAHYLHTWKAACAKCRIYLWLGNPTPLHLWQHLQHAVEVCFDCTTYIMATCQSRSVMQDGVQTGDAYEFDSELFRIMTGNHDKRLCHYTHPFEWPASTQWDLALRRKTQHYKKQAAYTKRRHWKRKCIYKKEGVPGTKKCLITTGI